MPKNNPRRSQVATKPGARASLYLARTTIPNSSSNQPQDRKKLVGTGTHNDHDDPPKHHPFRSSSIPLRTNGPRCASKIAFRPSLNLRCATNNPMTRLFTRGMTKREILLFVHAETALGNIKMRSCSSGLVVLKQNIVDHSQLSSAIGSRTMFVPTYPGSVSRGSSCGIAQKSRRGLTCVCPGRGRLREFWTFPEAPSANTVGRKRLESEKAPGKSDWTTSRQTTRELPSGWPNSSRLHPQSIHPARSRPARTTRDRATAPHYAVPEAMARQKGEH
jgi:hypothetical protein